MVYGVLRLINFAHADVMMVGAFSTLFLFSSVGLPFGVAVFLTLGLCGLFGMLIDRVAYRPLRQASKISMLITAIGVSFFLENLFNVLFGGSSRFFSAPDFFNQTRAFGSVIITNVAWIVPLITVLLLLAILWLLYRTRYGMAIRAVAFDVNTVRLMGIDANRIISLVFALGSSLAALGGVFYSISYPTIDPLMGVLIGLKAFAAAVLGGIGSVTGAVLAGINVVFNDYIVRVISTIFIFMILAVSYNLINGVTGQLSLEPNGFVAVGAYVTALLILSSDSKVDMFEMAAPSPWILSLHAGFLPALLISGLCAAALAVCLAVPVFRVRGDYLAIVTLGFGFIIKILAINNPQITNGAIGLNDIPQQPHLLFWCGLFALLATGMILQLVWSKYGRMMKAIRDDEDAAIAMGVNTFRIKTCAFATSAFFEGIGGGLLASLLTTISPGLFDFMLTFQLLIIIVLGGLGSTTGALLGTVLVVGSGEWLRFLDQPLQFFGHDLGAYPGLRMVVFSLLLLIIMLFAREGLLGKKEIWQTGRRSGGYGGK
ncbi:ABC transporter permease [Klebsiella pneumoniae]